MFDVGQKTPSKDYWFTKLEVNPAIDPKVFKALFAPNKATVIMGEERRGTWLDDTIMLPVTEAVGEVSSYGDYAENGTVSSNTNWPQRQAYLFQVIKQSERVRRN